MTDQTTPEADVLPVDGLWGPPAVFTDEQIDYLLNPLRKTRVATRSVSGKTLSYLEAWDVKAHFNRIFGFGGWDSETLEEKHVLTREYLSQQNKDMIEVVYHVRQRLTVRNPIGDAVCRYAEGAVGSASGPASSPGDLHDNALKTAASDALKRCAINLGTQFGLSLYDKGATYDVVGPGVLYSRPTAEVTAEQKAALENSLGATEGETP